MDSALKAEPEKIASHAACSNAGPCRSNSLLARRKRLEVRRFKMMMASCESVLDPSKRHLGMPKRICVYPNNGGSGTSVDTSSTLVKVTAKDLKSDLQIATVVALISGTNVAGNSGGPAVQTLSSSKHDQAVEAKTPASIFGNESSTEESLIPHVEEIMVTRSRYRHLDGCIPRRHRVKKDDSQKYRSPKNNGDQEHGRSENKESSSPRSWIEDLGRESFAPSVIVKGSVRRITEDDESCPQHGLVSVIGRRREMEDAAVAVPYFVTLPSKLDGSCAGQGSLHFYGVYDGHGGSHAALHCKDRLHGVLAEELLVAMGQRQHGEKKPAKGPALSPSEWESVVSNSFLRVDAEIGGICPRGPLCQKANGNTSCCPEPVAPETVGTTAVVAVVGSDQIVVGNCGDSRAVLSRGGKAIALSKDHKPNRQDEMERIEGAGGRVISWNGYRVFGVLAMSRALGDRYLKPYIIPDPEVTCIRRTEDDEFLILASDGLWDIASTEAVCNLTRKCMSGQKFDKQKYCDEHDNEESAADVAAAFLTKLALARGSSDNITVVVVDLKK